MLNPNSLVYKIFNLPIRLYLISLFSILYVFWGTSWELPAINITASYLWVAVSCFICLFFNKKNLNQKDFLIIGLIFFSLILYTILGIPKILSTDDPTRDVNFLIGYDIRYFFGFVTFFALINLIKKDTDIDLFVWFLLIFFIPLSLYLTWKYLYVFGVNYVGVVINEGPNYANKNSLGTALALIFPFFIAGLFRKKLLMVLSLIGLVTLIIFLFNLSSRSVLIILGIEVLSLMYFSKSVALRRATISISSVLALVILILGISLYDWIRKSGDFAPTYQDSVEVEEPFMETHRAWLIFEGLRGFRDSGGLGNGVATFRIRPTNLGSRTETHNDYLQLMYEQGVIGLFLILFLFYFRIKETIKIVSKTGNRYVEASLASLFGLVVALLFVNIINTMVFWSLIALNYSLLEIVRNQEKEKGYK